MQQKKVLIDRPFVSTRDKNHSGDPNLNICRQAEDWRGYSCMKGFVERLGKGSTYSLIPKALQSLTLLYHTVIEHTGTGWMLWTKPFLRDSLMFFFFLLSLSFSVAISSSLFVSPCFSSRNHGTPMLLEGVRCVGVELEYDSEQSDWQGFD